MQIFNKGDSLSTDKLIEEKFGIILSFKSGAHLIIAVQNSRHP